MLASCLAAAASATAPKAHKVERTVQVSGSYDGAWSALIDLFASNNWPIANMEKTSGLVVTSWMDAGANGERFADCGSSPTARQTEVRFNVRVKEGPPVSLTVNTLFRQMRKFGESEGYIDCHSRGVVEAMIQDAVMAGVSKPNPAPDERKTVYGTAPLFCSTESGKCTLNQSSCTGTCEERKAGSCFNAIVVLDERKETICAATISDCETMRAGYAESPDYKITRCGIYRMQEK